MAELSESMVREIGGYRIERGLSPAGSLLAKRPDGRRVVLKPLESDCLLGEQLHPMIRDRLERIRELAHLGVAQLYSVERNGERAYLVWQFVDGVPLEEHLSGGQADGARLAGVARDLVLGVESLHALGIIHGALHGRNVIVTPEGQVRLTHISPLLYSDPRVDVEALLEVLAGLGVDRGEENGAVSLRELANRVAAPQPPVASGRESAADSAAARDGRWARRTALIAAVVVAALGVAIAWGIWRYASRLAPAQGIGADVPQAGIAAPAHPEEVSA